MRARGCAAVMDVMHRTGVVEGVLIAHRHGGESSPTADIEANRAIVGDRLVGCERQHWTAPGAGSLDFRRERVGESTIDRQGVLSRARRIHETDPSIIQQAEILCGQTALRRAGAKLDNAVAADERVGGDLQRGSVGHQQGVIKRGAVRDNKVLNGRAGEIANGSIRRDGVGDQRGVGNARDTAWHPSGRVCPIVGDIANPRFIDGECIGCRTCAQQHYYHRSLENPPHPAFTWLRPPHDFSVIVV